MSIYIPTSACIRVFCPNNGRVLRYFERVFVATFFPIVAEIYSIFLSVASFQKLFLAGYQMTLFVASCGQKSCNSCRLQQSFHFLLLVNNTPVTSSMVKVKGHGHLRSRSKSKSCDPYFDWAGCNAYLIMILFLTQRHLVDTLPILLGNVAWLHGCNYNPQQLDKICL